LIQQDKKNFQNEVYQYSTARFILSRMEGGNFNYVCGKMAQERDFFEEKVLEEGEYLLYVEVDWVDKEYPFVISTYSESAIELSAQNNDDYPNILQKIYKSCALQEDFMTKFEQEGAPECVKYSCDNNFTPEGFSYIYFVNKEEDVTLVEDVKYTKFSGLKLLPPYSGSSYQIEIKPGEEKIILIKRVDTKDFSLAYSSNTNFKFGKKSLVNLAKQKGTKSNRKDPKLNIEVDIVVYTYKHSLGLCFYYENNTTDRKLEENVRIKATGVEIVDYESSVNMISIILAPGESKLIDIQAKNKN